MTRVLIVDDDTDHAESLADVKAAKVPSVVMVTGPALGSVQVLIDAKWVCIGEVPLMQLPAERVPPDPHDEAGSEAARAIGRALTAHYATLIKAPLPDKFVELLAQLEQGPVSPTQGKRDALG